VRLRRRLDPQRVDMVVAALLLVGAEVQLAMSDPIGVAWFVKAGAWALITGAVAFRRRYPVAVGIGVQALQVLGTQLAPERIVGPPAVAVAWFMALYGLAVWTGTRMFVVGTAFFAVTNFAPWTHFAFGDVAVPFTTVTVVVMVLVRQIVRDRDRRAELAERERDVAAREAVVDERARIARELHDAIAHSVSMMVLQAGAERRVLDGRPGGTREALEAIERTGRSALTEMRRLVGMLRSDRPDPLTPQPGLDDLPTLVTQVREAGLPVEFHVDGDPRSLPVGVGLSAYRIVQEALTNVVKHAGNAHATVRVRYCTDSLELEISDDGTGRDEAASGSGHGLVGMRERVALYGGWFSAGHGPGGGFAVHAGLPLR
jgi:signal transduction histidine kinase